MICRTSFFNAGLSAAQVRMLAHALPDTHVETLQLEWNVPPSVDHPVAAAGGASSETTGPTTSDQGATTDAKDDVDVEVKQEDDAEVATALAALLSDASPLVALSLRANGVSTAAAVAMAHQLRTNKKLRSLNLFQNDVGDAGAVALAHALPFNATLKSLSLANNRLSGVAYAPMARI